MSNQPLQSPTLKDHVANHKNAVMAKTNDVIGIVNNIIDSWASNFFIVEKVKNKRTEQLNFILGFVNQMAQQGLTELTTLGNELKDPELSNKVLDANNILMTLARNLQNKINEQEVAFTKEIAELNEKQKQVTQVKATEA